MAEQIPELSRSRPRDSNAHETEVSQHKAQSRLISLYRLVSGDKA